MVNPPAVIQSLSLVPGETNGSQNLILVSEKDHKFPESMKFADNMDHRLIPCTTSSTRGMLTDSPVLEKNAASLSSEGCLKSEHSPRRNICGAHDPSIFVPSNVNAALNADHKVETLVRPSQKILPSKVEGEYDVQGQEMFSSSTMLAETILKEKTEHLTTKRQYHNTRNCDNAPRKLRRRNVTLQAGQSLVDSSSNLKGASDIDHNQLLAAANSVHISKRLASDSPYWSQMEDVFAPVTPEGLEFLKKQMDLSVKCREWPSQMFVDENATLGLNEIEGASKKHRNDKAQGSVDSDPLFQGAHSLSRFDKVPSLAQRVLSALIDEDKVEDLYHQNEGSNISFQCTNDTPDHGSPDVMAIDPKNCNRVLTEVKLGVNFQAPDNCLLDGVSCNRNIASHTQSNRCESSSSHCNEQCSTNGCLSFPARGELPVISKEDPGSNFSLKLSTSDIASCSSQYQSLPLDDKIQMELESIGVHLDFLPCPPLVEKSIDQYIAELEVEMEQESRKKTKILSQIDEAIKRESQVEKRNVEQRAMYELLIMAYKKFMAYRGGNSSRNAANKAVEGKTMAFVNRTLARCKEYESTEKSCFAEPGLKEVLFSPPCEKDIKSAVSKLRKSFRSRCHKKATLESYPGDQENGAASNAGKAASSGEVKTGDSSGSKVCLKLSSVSSLNDDSSSSRVKRKKSQSETCICCAPKATETVKGKRSARRSGENRSTHTRSTAGITPPSAECSGTKRNKAEQKQKLDHLSALESQLHEVPISADPAIENLSKILSPLSDTVGDVAVSGSIEKADPCPPPPSDPAEVSIANDVGGDDGLTLLNLEEDKLMELDCVGLAVPMDDLCDFQLS